MIDYLSIVDTNKVNHAVETDMVKLVVKIESFGMSADELDKEIGSSNGLQPKQADLSCVHALNETHLHEIHVVPSKHEADQCWLCANSKPFDIYHKFAPLRRKSILKLGVSRNMFRFHIVDVHVIE
ncbi:hypothetical protein Tco_0367602 [Tanacetum coccineum]